MAEKGDKPSASLARMPPRALLTRILEEPALVGVVQALAPRTLGRLIDHVGLEDAGELVALASTAQLQAIFDEDLWKSAGPGRDETFDAERFAVWLEVMLDAGEEVAVDKLAELPEDLVALAFHRHALVINADELAVSLSEEREREIDLVEKALDSVLYVELGEYHVIARRHDGWDAFVTLLLALDKRDHETLVRLLERCGRASTEYFEEHGGMYEVLTSDEMLESDASAEREERRALEGFVAPSAATAFLASARTTALETLVASDAVDATTRAYFREYAAAHLPATAAAGAAATDPAVASGVRALVALLDEAGVLDEARPALRLEAGAPAAEARGAYRHALAALSVRDEAAHGERMRELSYLANVLVAGCSVRGRRMRPLEAAEAALATCNLGLERLGGGEPRAAATRADKLFRIGWHLLAAVRGPADACPWLPHASGAAAAGEPRFVALAAELPSARR